jgi:hypothetical protein
LPTTAALTICATLALDPEEDLDLPGGARNDATADIYRVAERNDDAVRQPDFRQHHGAHPIGVAITGGQETLL